MGSRKKTAGLDGLTKKGFDIKLLSHAESILVGEFAPQLRELIDVLEHLALPISEIIGSGGGETQFTQRTRKALSQLAWHKHHFVIEKTVDGVRRESTSHEVDHVKRVEGVGTIGLEIEWNNKDPFFDRDLENFKRLHAEGAISLGIVITRGASLQASLEDLVRRFAVDRKITNFETLARAGVIPTPKQRKNIAKRTDRERDPVDFVKAWVENFVGNKFGAATTHWEKLMARVERGVGNPCPLLLIGLPASIVVFDDKIVDPIEDDTESAEA